MTIFEVFLSIAELEKLEKQFWAETCKIKWEYFHLGVYGVYVLFPSSFAKIPKYCT